MNSINTDMKITIRNTLRKTDLINQNVFARLLKCLPSTVPTADTTTKSINSISRLLYELYKKISGLSIISGRMTANPIIIAITIFL